MRKVLRRLMAGRATGAEEADVRAWLAEDPDGPALLARLDAARHVIQGEERRGAVDAESLLGTLRARRATRVPAYRVAGIAAAIVVALGVSLLARRTGTPAMAVSTRDYVAARGHRLALTLADGSRITLAPGSRLTVAASGIEGRRAVALDGEAYFAVTHDARCPFTVRTAWGIARDVGTVFDVRAFGEDSGMRVTVAEGRVAVAPSGVQIGAGPVLGATTAALVDRSGRILVQPNADVASATVWLQGGLAFDKAPLPHVVRALERAFDIEITVTDSALDREALTATFGDEPVDNVLDAVTRSIGAEYRRVGRIVTIRRRMRPAAPVVGEAQVTVREIRGTH